MFRFIAIAWNASDEMASAAAERFGSTLGATADFELALNRPGLEVFTVGASPGVNEALHLQGGLGLVLGKMFRHGDHDASATRHVTLTPAEAARVLDTLGQSLVDDFWGRYVAFFRTASGSTRVLRDPSGALPCYCIHRDGVAIVFSWLEDALQLLDGKVSPTVNWDGLTAHLLGVSLNGRPTALEGVMQVLPGESFDLHRQDSRFLWRAVDFARSPATCDFSSAIHSLRRTVQTCTQAWASCYDTLLLRLSGGVDSSILLSCLAADRTATDVIGLNYHSEGSDSDERHYARLAATRVGRDLIERERDREFRVERLAGIARMPEPVRYLGWMNSAADASVARAHAAPAMFTGAGGDSVFFEFPRWWPAADYLSARGFGTGFFSAAMDAARLSKLSVWRVIALALRERASPRLSERAMLSAVPLLAQELCRDTQKVQDLVRRFVHPSLCETEDIPIGKYMQTAALMFPLTYYNPFEQAAAPEIVNPLLSQPLLELCLRLPTYLLTQGGHGRSLVRRAFARDLPSQIVNRRSKGGLEEHVKLVLESNLGTIRPMLLEGHLARRGLLDRARVEEALSGRPSAQAAPLSQIHALVAAEAWLSRWNS